MTGGGEKYLSWVVVTWNTPSPLETPPEQTSPWADTLWADPHLGRHPTWEDTSLGRHPPGQTPPGQTPSAQFMLGYTPQAATAADGTHLT